MPPVTATLSLATLGALYWGVPGLPRRLDLRVLLGIAILAALALVGGDAEAAFRRGLSVIALQPILSLYLGLLMGVLLVQGGAGDLLRAILVAPSRFLGGPAGAVAILSLMPLLLSLPCGHALSMGLLMAVLEPGREGRAVQHSILAAAFLRTAYGTCAPASAGGIARIGESVLGGADLLRAPQLFALIVAAGATAAYARALMTGGEKLALATAPPIPSTPASESTRSPVLAGALLLIFLLTVAAAAHAGVRRMEDLTWLGVGAGLMALTAALGGRIAPSRVFESVPLQPVVDVTLGFLLAAALEAAGGLTLLASFLEGAGEWSFPGREGLLILLGFLPLMLPLACGRILAAALVPLVARLGFAPTPLAACVGMLTLFAAMSCVVSPFGGCLAFLGAKAEPRRAAQRAALDLAAVGTAAPLVAAYLRWMTGAGEARPELVLLVSALVVGINLVLARRSGRGRGAMSATLVVQGALAGGLTAAIAFAPEWMVFARGLGAGALAGAWIAWGHLRRVEVQS